MINFTQLKGRKGLSQVMLIAALMLMAALPARAQGYQFVKQTEAAHDSLWTGNYIIALYDPNDATNQYAFNATPINENHRSFGTQIQLSADFSTITDVGQSKIVSVEYGGKYNEGNYSGLGLPDGTHYYYISYEKDGKRYYLGYNGSLELAELSARPLTSRYRWFFYKDNDGNFLIHSCTAKTYLRSVVSQHAIYCHTDLGNSNPLYLYRWNNDNYHEINITSAGMGSISCLGTAMSNSYSDYIAYPDSVVTIVTKPIINFESLTVTDEDDNVLPITDNGDGTYTFTMPESNVTIDVRFSDCEDFEEYPGAVTAATETSTAAAYGFTLPEGWRQIYNGEDRFRPHLVKGTISKNQEAILANAGYTVSLSSSYTSDKHNYTYLVSPYWLHEGDVISFNAWTSKSDGVTMRLYYGYMTDPLDPTDKSKFVSLGEATTVESANMTDFTTDGRTSFVVPAAAEGHWLTFRWYVYSNNYTRYVIIDNICVSEQAHLWTEYVTSDPGAEHFEVDASGNVTIKSKEGLAWLISYVNGLNNVEGGAHNMSGKTVTLTADVNMSEHVWVPIGINSTTPFQGTFDGNYHTIDVIHIANTTEIGYVEGSDKGTNGDMQYTGMFGYTTGATIKNTFLTSGSLACDGASGYLGGLVGYAYNTKVEFCEAAVTLKALGHLYSLGGVIGTTDGTATNTKALMSVCDIECGSNDVEYLGGVVGTNIGSTGNTMTTYFSNTNISGTGSYTGYGALNGTASDVGGNAYLHKDATTGAERLNGITDGANDYAFAGTTYADATDTYTASDYSYGASNNTLTNGASLVDSLNAHVADGYRWIRAAGSNINDGYPIIVPTENIELGCVAKVGSKVLRFGELNEMIELYNDSTDYEVFMYNNGTISEAPTSVHLYIDENVAMKQSTNDDINATVSVTLDNSKGTAEMHRDWHMFATSLSNAPMGIKDYNQAPAVPTFPSTSENDLTLGTDYNIDANGYFPAGLTASSQFDFYSFYETQYHWINLKRAGNNHWHQDEIDGAHPQIHYYGRISEEGNEEKLIPGKGYLVAMGNNANANNNLMQASGILNNGTLDFGQVTSKGEHLKGYNLLGNPYQSYLDFNKFAEVNKENLWGDGGGDATGYRAYLIYDADLDYFDEYLIDNNSVSFSLEAYHSAKQYINMHQGFFVVRNNELTSDSVSVRYTEDMRCIDTMDIHFRADVPHYPLVNLFCTDSDGKKEVAVMEFERPLKAGSLKMKGMLNGKANMYIHWNGDDLGSVFIDHMPDYVPVWFETSEDGVFTMTWNTANANFGYMHLIDHLTGTDYDCLAPGNDHYTFEAKTTDMAARFRLVFKPLGIDENEVENANFAFFNGEQLIVNGSGDMQLIDVNGRILMTEHLSGEQNSISLPNVAAGVYMLRMIGDSESRIQKIVVRK